MTAAEWAQRENLRMELNDLLTNSVLKTALEVLLAEEVSHSIVADTRVDALQQTALSGANREGFFRFYRSLLALTKPPAIKARDLSPWEHIEASR